MSLLKVLVFAICFYYYYLIVKQKPKSQIKKNNVIHDLDMNKLNCLTY